VSSPWAACLERDGPGLRQPMCPGCARCVHTVRFPRVLSMAVDPTDHRIVWAGVEVDGVRRSLDGGDTWETTGAAVTPGKIGLQLNTFATHSADPDLVLTCSHYGQVFISNDAGDSWRKVRREFSEIRGWTYSNDGQLVGVPAVQEAYFGELDTRQWGLMRWRSWRATRGWGAEHEQREPDDHPTAKGVEKVMAPTLQGVKTHGGVVNRVQPPQEGRRVAQAMVEVLERIAQNDDDDDLQPHRAGRGPETAEIRQTEG
jgi:hypothetical protein